MMHPLHEAVQNHLLVPIPLRLLTRQGPKDSALRGILTQGDERLRTVDHCEVLTTPEELEAAIGARLQALRLGWVAA